MDSFLRRPALLGLAVLTVAAAGCSYVGRDDFDTTVADIRSDLEDHEQRISQNEEAIASLQSDVTALQRSLEQLRNDFQVRMERLETGVRFVTPVHFNFDEAAVREVDKPLLDRFAAIVQEFYPEAMVTIEGFADPAGSRAYNERLSEDRAANVRDYLADQAGLEGIELRTIGYGENRLVIPGAAGPGEQGIENRRVTFVVEFAPTG